MHYVILRDDDTNAFTPASHLDRLYRPFLERDLSVNLAVIPYVRSDLTMPDGRPEGFLVARQPDAPRAAPIGWNHELVDYLRRHSRYHIAQHGCHHDPHEFDSEHRATLIGRLGLGAKLLAEAGFGWPRTFVAPHDKLSRTSFELVAPRFKVLSTGWYELRRLPWSWWPNFLWKKLTHAPHWQVNGTILLSHPGCLLSYQRSHETMLDQVKNAVEKQKLTVLVTHWWEYFRNREPDEDFIRVLHQTAEYLAENRYLKVVSFDELANGWVPLK